MNYHAVKIFLLDKLERELSDKLSYHSIYHTQDVLRVTEELCMAEKISPYETLLLKTAALFHDSGFTKSNLNHEEHGCTIARTVLPHYDYTSVEIERICGMIMATKIPQSPQNFLEQIICDADLDYLGRDDFYTIGNTLFEELQAYNVLHSKLEWNKLQIKFLSNQQFFTPTNKRRREPQKQVHLQALKEWLLVHE